MKLSKDWKQEINNTVVMIENVLKSDKAGKATGIIQNCKGEIQGNISLSGVMFLTNSKYNLISFTKVMKKLMEVRRQ
jgi:hypothetical protein